MAAISAAEIQLDIQHACETNRISAKIRHLQQDGLLPNLMAPCIQEPAATGSFLPHEYAARHNSVTVLHWLVFESGQAIDVTVHHNLAFRAAIRARGFGAARWLLEESRQLVDMTANDSEVLYSFDRILEIAPAFGNWLFFTAPAAVAATDAWSRRTVPKLLLDSLTINSRAFQTLIHREPAFLIQAVEIDQLTVTKLRLGCRFTTALRDATTGLPVELSPELQAFFRSHPESGAEAMPISCRPRLRQLF